MNKETAFIARNRLINQQILEPCFEQPVDLVSHMGAMQAQDYAMSKWAIACRLKNSAENDISSALNKGELVRTHLMRPTWHIVSANDCYWLLELSAPNIRSGLKGRHRDLELTDPFLRKTNRLIEKALRNGNHHTRDELAVLMKAEKIRLDNNRLAHILMNAELDQLICNGVERGKKQTYALLPERVPEKITLSKDEALHELALRYFKSHGPATLADFQWWSGLKVKEAREALELVKSELNCIQDQEEEYWFEHLENDTIANAVKLLPAYDEFLISYKNRSAVLNPEFNSKALSNNGMFWPIVVVNGMVAGTWKRTIKKDTVQISFHLFQKANLKLRSDLEAAARDFGNFIGKEVTF